MLFPMTEPSLMLRHAIMNLTIYQDDPDLTARALPELLKLLTDKDQVVVSQATMMFYQLSKKEASRHAMMSNPQLIAALYRVLGSSKDPETIKGAMGILHSISHHQRGLVVISKPCWIPVLVKLLSSPVESVLSSAIKTIHNLLRHYDKCKLAVHLAGGVQKMLPLLDLLRNKKTLLAIVTDCLKILDHDNLESKQLFFGDISFPKLTKLNKPLKNLVFVEGYQANRVNAGAVDTRPVPVATLPAGNGNGNATSPVDDDDDMESFGFNDGEEETAAIKLREKRWAENPDNNGQPGPIDISSVILDVKPWGAETDMKEMEKKVRTIEMDGFLWGASKLVPVGDGMPRSFKKLKIICVMEDNTISIEALQEEIKKFEDYVAAVDVAAFNKL